MISNGNWRDRNEREKQAEVGCGDATSANTSLFIKVLFRALKFWTSGVLKSASRQNQHLQLLLLFGLPIRIRSSDHSISISTLKESRKLKNQKYQGAKSESGVPFFTGFRSSKSELHILGYSYIRVFNSEGSGGIISASNLNSELTSEQEPTSESKVFSFHFLIQYEKQI
ncbi:hypothetical protein LXL04_008993 [Taraxacum kok-saghyz]